MALSSPTEALKKHAVQIIGRGSSHPHSIVPDSMDLAEPREGSEDSPAEVNSSSTPTVSRDNGAPQQRTTDDG